MEFSTQFKGSIDKDPTHADLYLPLKKQWFDMTKSGEKTEDYREVNEHWFKRLVFHYKDVFSYCTGVNWDSCEKREEYIKVIAKHKAAMVGFNPYNLNIMTLGYPKKGDAERTLQLLHKGIEINTGIEAWGAEPERLYFVIKHGMLLS